MANCILIPNCPSVSVYKRFLQFRLSRTPGERCYAYNMTQDSPLLPEDVSLNNCNVT